MKLTSILLATLAIIASINASPLERRSEDLEEVEGPKGEVAAVPVPEGPKGSDESIVVEGPKGEAAAAPVPVIPEYAMMYGFNPPRQNPEWCQGFHIDHPSTPGLVFAAGSHQYAQWSVEDKDLTNAPEVVFRIRILNATQNNNLNIGENIPLYNKGKTGSVFFPLKVTDVDGLYHLRFMVKYTGQELNCVYESVPFMVVHNPAQKYTTGEAPYFDTNPSYTYMTKSMEDLYERINTTAVFV